ncbi:MAG: NAD(P)-dependent alcohol dehydrogenase [Myxococcaceae bacterium]
MTAATLKMTEAVVVSATMQAVAQRRYGGPETLEVTERARPEPKTGEVLVQVKAAGLDRGTWHLMTGRPYLMRLVFGFSAPKDPVRGRELAGVVTAVGPGVTRFAVGDAVFGIGEGTFAEFACAREDKLARKPARWSFAEAAASAISALTAIQALDAAQVKAGEQVLVVGASGGVGTFLLQLARARGAHCTAVSSAGKAALVRSLGAETVIDYAREDFTARDQRFDVILDVGGNTALSKLRRVLAPTGRLVFVGGENGGDITAGFGRQLLAMVLAPFTRQRFLPFLTKERSLELDQLAALAEQGLLKTVIDREVPLTGVADAMRALEAGQVRGKIVVMPTARG